MAARFLVKFVKSNSGAAAAEMALIAPMLVILLFGFFEIGNYFWNEHIAMKGVRDGARYAARQSFNNFDCGAGSVSNAGVAAAIKNVTRTGKISGGAARVSGWTDAEVKVTVSCNAGVKTGIYNNMATGAPVVTVQTENLDYPSLFETLGFDTLTLKIRARSQSAVMGA